MTEKTLTDTISLRARLAAAQARERAARADAARLRREMAAADRRRETQILCTLGRAWLAWGERDERFRAAAQRWLVGYVLRPTDRDALAGTPWAVPELKAPHAEAPAEGVAP
jgi:hypothetical protein